MLPDPAKEKQAVSTGPAAQVEAGLNEIIELPIIADARVQYEGMSRLQVESSLGSTAGPDKSEIFRSIPDLDLQAMAPEDLRQIQETDKPTINIDGRTFVSTIEDRGAEAPRHYYKEQKASESREIGFIQG